MSRFCSIPALSSGLSVAAAVCMGAIAFGCLTPASAQAPPSYYAAIAVSPFSSSDPNIRWGTASWQTSQSAADQAALDQCRARGGRTCKVEAQSSSMHLALWFSEPDKAWGVEGGDSPDLAKAIAVGQCVRKVENIANCRFPSEATASSEPGRAAGIDPKVVGTWELSVNGGRWVLEIDPRGTYEFHSEASDGYTPNSGKFSTNAGYWSLQATNGYTDAGTYSILPPDTFVATSQRLERTGNWRHPVNAAPPLDQKGQRLFVLLATDPPKAEIWSKVGTALIKATGSTSPPIGQAVVTYELEPLVAGLPTNVMLRIFPTSEAAAAYVDDKQLLANYLTDLPPGVVSYGHIDPIAPFDHPSRYASTIQSKEQRGWLRWAYQEGRVVILVTTGEAKPHVQDNDSISDDIFRKGLQLLQIGEIWLKQKEKAAQ
jgi:hypothetical protein